MSDIAEQAERIYEEKIRPLVEKDHFGKVVSIGVESGDYEVATDRRDRLGAVRRLRERHESPQVFSLGIGGGPVARIGGFRKVREKTA